MHRIGEPHLGLDLPRRLAPRFDPPRERGDLPRVRGQPIGPREPHHPRELREVRRVLLERAQCDRAQLRGRVGPEQVRSAVNRVHRLPPRRLARMRARECEVAGAQPIRRGPQLVRQ